MTTRQRLENSGLNLNSLLLIISIIGALTTTVFFFEPLRRIPGNVEEMQKTMRGIENTQTAQTAAITTLAELAKDAKDAKSKFDDHRNETILQLNRHAYEIDGAKKRLDRLEREP